MISVDANNGLIDMDYEIEKYVPEDEVDLEDLVNLLDNQYADRLDFIEVKQATNNKFLDNYLRDKLLEFAALKMIYSKKTTPERGYERAKRFFWNLTRNLI